MGLCFYLLKNYFVEERMEASFIIGWVEVCFVEIPLLAWLDKKIFHITPATPFVIARLCTGINLKVNAPITGQ